MITVTLSQIKNANQCHEGWLKVLAANGGVNADMDKPFPLSSVLDSNDLDDTLWVIQNVPEMREHDEIWRKFACWCASQTIEMIEPYCPAEDFELIDRYLTTQDDGIRESARLAAANATNAANATWAARAVWAAEATACAASATWAAANAAANAANANASTGAAEAAVCATWAAAWATKANAATGGTGTKATQAAKLRELIG